MAQGPKEIWIERVLGVRVGAGSPRLEEALKEWESRRAEVRARLSELDRAIRAADDPEADEAVKLIGGIGKNLIERPDTPQKVKELEDYLIAEDLVDDAETPNGFGVTVSIREPLLLVLRKVKAALGA
jgi:hypothetical protein